MVAEFELYKNDELEIRTFKIQDIIDILENEIEINCIDDLFDKNVMQDYRLEVVTHQLNISLQRSWQIKVYLVVYTCNQKERGFKLW